jgi:hypothetical protein
MSTDRVDPNSAGSLLRATQAVPLGKQVWLPTGIRPRGAKGRSDIEGGSRRDREFSTSNWNSFQSLHFLADIYERNDLEETGSNKCAM